MKRFLTAVIAACLLAAPVLAQNNDEDLGDPYGYDSHTMKGDQYLRISLEPVFPMNFPDFKSLFIKDAHQLSTGGMGNIGYHYFVTKDIAVGGDIGFGFNVTIGSHVFNYVPIVATVTYQPSFKKFEFPLTLGLGFAWETYSNYNYFPGLIIKPEAGVHYRLTPSWSVGGDFGYMFMPQFKRTSKGGTQNMFGHFTMLEIVARYYF